MITERAESSISVRASQPIFDSRFFEGYRLQKVDIITTLHGRHGGLYIRSSRKMFGAAHWGRWESRKDWRAKRAENFFTFLQKTVILNTFLANS